MKCPGRLIGLRCGLKGDAKEEENKATIRRQTRQGRQAEKDIKKKASLRGRATGTVPCNGNRV